MKLEIKKFKHFIDRTGHLAPFYENEHFKNFKLKRFFFVYGKTSFARADHAHKKCNQILIPIFGKIKVEITNKKNIKKIYILSLKNKKFLYVPKKNWIASETATVLSFWQNLNLKFSWRTRGRRDPP